jgi:zinc transport system permease protein
VEDFLLRAVLAGVGVAAVAGPLGSFVVWRRMAYFGPAIAHSALLGVALALLLEINLTLGIFAVSAVLAVALVGLQRYVVLPTDTLLSILAHAGLALGLVVIAFMETVRVDLMAYLFGDILAVTAADLYLIYGAAVLSLAVLILIWHPFLSLTVHEELARVDGVAVTRVRLVFMLLIAVVVALALKVVGLLLITSLLIIPAAAARRVARTPEQMAVLAGLIGCLSVLLGLWGSSAWDTPAGPSIVVAATVAFLLSRLWPRLTPS